MRKVERSAGVIVFRIDPHTNQRLYLLLDYGPYWDLPKGHIEAGEDDLAAALRELQEETALTNVQLVPGFKREIRYFFRELRQLIDKTVIYFLARTDQTQITLSHEHVGGEFVDFPTAMRRLRFPNTRELLRLAEQAAQEL